MDTTFKQTLKEELSFQNMTVKELAYKTSISPRTLEGYLGTRGSIPPADAAVKIARALNVTVEYLVTGTAQDGQDTEKTDQLLLRTLKKLSDRDKKLLISLSEAMGSLPC